MMDRACATDGVALPLVFIDTIATTGKKIMGLPQRLLGEGWEVREGGLFCARTSAWLWTNPLILTHLRAMGSAARIENVSYITDCSLIPAHAERPSTCAPPPPCAHSLELCVRHACRCAHLVATPASSCPCACAHGCAHSQQGCKRCNFEVQKAAQKTGGDAYARSMALNGWPPWPPPP